MTFWKKPRGRLHARAEPGVCDLTDHGLVRHRGICGVAFNMARGLTYTAYGSPAAPPFTGNTLQSCYSNVPNTMFGPYRGSVIASAYAAASA